MFSSLSWWREQVAVCRVAVAVFILFNNSMYILYVTTLSCCSSPFRWRCLSAPQQRWQLSDSGQQCLLLHPAGGRQAVAGHVQQRLKAGGGLHRAAHRTGTTIQTGQINPNSQCGYTQVLLNTPNHTYQWLDVVRGGTFQPESKMLLLSLVLNLCKRFKRAAFLNWIFLHLSGGVHFSSLSLQNLAGSVGP